MKFVEELVLGRQCGLKHFANFVVCKPGVSIAMTLQDSTSVGIDYEHRMFAGVEKDGVGGFRADAAKGEKLSAKNVRVSGEKAGEGARI